MISRVSMPRYWMILATSLLLVATVLFSACTTIAPVAPAESEPAQEEAAAEAEPAQEEAAAEAETAQEEAMEVVASACSDGMVNTIMMQGGGWVGVTRELIPDFTAETGIEIAIEEQPYIELILGEQGMAIGRGEAELPERLIARAVLKRGGSAAIKDLNDDEELKAAGCRFEPR